MKNNIFRDNKIHVMAEMCETCVFRPGNLMHLKPGRVAGMVKEARGKDGTIVCHSTLYQPGKPEHAVCRGFFDHHKTQLLQIAERLGVVEWQKA